MATTEEQLQSLQYAHYDVSNRFPISCFMHLMLVFVVLKPTCCCKSLVVELHKVQKRNRSFVFIMQRDNNAVAVFGTMEMPVYNFV